MTPRSEALRPLAAIADAYDANNLDSDGARKEWGQPLDRPRPAFDQVEIYAGRGGTRLLTLADAFAARRALKTGSGFSEAMRPLQAIARAYHANELDDEARKFWGSENQHQNETAPADIPLVCARGGAVLLTLADALAAR